MKKDESTVELRWVRWRVTGRVQGVGFRQFVYRTATASSLVGDVRNLEDGSVEIRVRGGSAELKRFLGEVRRGNDGSRVDDVEQLDPDPSAAMTWFQIF